MLQVSNEEMNENGAKEKERNNSYKVQHKYNFVRDNWKQRERRKTYVKALKEVFGNKVKETREKVVSDKERNSGIRENDCYVNTVMDCNEKKVVRLVSLNQIFRQFTTICCFLSKLTPQEWFQHLFYLTQTHQLLIML